MDLILAILGNHLPAQLKLVHDMLETYDKKSRPVWDYRKPINVTFSMELYQILEVVSELLVLSSCISNSQTVCEMIHNQEHDARGDDLKGNGKTLDSRKN